MDVIKFLAWLFIASLGTIVLLLLAVSVLYVWLLAAGMN